MYFEKYEFRHGMNMSVRRRYYDTQADTGGNITLAGPDDRKSIAKMYYEKIKRFEDVTAEDLRHHHLGIDNWADMHLEMKRHYMNFDRDEIVTLVYFRLV